MLRLALNPTSKNAGTERSISFLNMYCGKMKFIIQTLGVVSPAMPRLTSSGSSA
jgi:hypothetical protein